PTEVPEQIRFPVLVKARRGFGSRHIYRADNQTELDFFLLYTTADSMVQCLCHGEEFSIDVFCDLDGRCLAAVPRTMIESEGVVMTRFFSQVILEEQDGSLQEVQTEAVREEA